jgi:hypothetical protein
MHTFAENHKDQFNKPILGPICIELEVDNDTDGKYLEASNNIYNEFFVAQTKADYSRSVYECAMPLDIFACGFYRRCYGLKSWCVHTYIHTYMHTYIHTYMNT